MLRPFAAISRGQLFLFCGISCHCAEALTGVIPLNAAPLSIFWLVQSTNCRAAIFQEAGSIPPMPRCHFSTRRRYLQIAMPPFFKRPAQSPGCCPAIFQEADTIFRLPHRHFSRGRRDSQSSPCHNFSRGWRYLQIAAPQFFKRPVRSPDCRGTVFLLAGAIF